MAAVVLSHLLNDYIVHETDEDDEDDDNDEDTKGNDVMKKMTNQECEDALPPLLSPDSPPAAGGQAGRLPQGPAQVLHADLAVAPHRRHDGVHHLAPQAAVAGAKVPGGGCTARCYYLGAVKVLQVLKVPELLQVLQM